MQMKTAQRLETTLKFDDHSQDALMECVYTKVMDTTLGVGFIEMHW